MDRLSSVRAILEIDAASEPISGSLLPAGGEPRRFRGWIELTGAIESVRTAPPVARAPRADGHEQRFPPDIGAPR